MAMGGSSPWESLINQKAGMAKTSVEQGASKDIATSTSDIFSQLNSMGVAGGSGGIDIANKNATGIRSNAAQSKAQIDQAAISTSIDSIMKSLGLGMQGLSDSSSGGDLLAGLTSLANIFSGGLVGLGTQGLDILGGGNKKGGGNVSGWDAFTKRMG
jgi:hypothetical protein